MEQAHFSTVFVALLWGAGLPERGASLPRPHGAQPCTGLQQETACFHFTGPTRQCVQVGLHMGSGVLLGTLLLHQLQSWVPNILHALMTTPQAAAQTGRFPNKWNCSSPIMTAMPAHHCILAIGQTWQPQCLGRREGSHGLLLDALVLVPVSRSRSHTSSSPFG